MTEQPQPRFAAGGPIIECRGVEKFYPDGHVEALRGVDLEVAPGEMVAITGPSGCGKSTLLHLLAAIDTATAGTMTVAGYDLMHLGDPDQYRRREVGLVFQLHNLLPQLSALGNVEVAMEGTGLHRKVRTARAQQLLAEMDLGELADRRPPQLSGGERQRVAIARALANDPPVLLADEPTGSLDSDSVRTVLKVFERLRDERGVTIVLVTHDAGIAGIAHRVIEMLDGRVRTPAGPGAAVPAPGATVPAPGATNPATPATRRGPSALPLGG